MSSKKQKDKLTKEIVDFLDAKLKDYAYVASITIMEEYKKEGNKIKATGFGINIGNIGLNEPFSKVNALLQAFLQNAHIFIKSKYRSIGDDK